MSPWLIGALIWGVGALISFRWEARYLVARKNWRRDKAVREARNSSWLWPLVVLVWFLCGAWDIGARLLTAGIPESRADRDEAIKRLEEEVLVATEESPADRMHRSLQEAMNATTADEDEAELLRQDMAYLDRLEESRGICGPDTRLPSGKTMGQISPAYRPRGYVSTHRPDYPRRGVKPESTRTKDQEAEYEAVNQARRALELLRRLSAMGVLKDPATGNEISAAIRKARDTLRDAERGHLTATRAKATLAQVTRLERVLKAQEIVKEGGAGERVCSRCGCPVVQGRVGYIHMPGLGYPGPCSRATVAKLPWHQTPENSPERQEVYRRTMEAFRAGPFGRDMDTEEAATMRELQKEFPVELEPDLIRSISLDGTETEIQINRLQMEGYTITYLAGNEPPEWNGMTTRRIKEELTKNSTLSTTRAIHLERHKDSPTMACPFCAIDALE